jgi:probable addiction module antidote protein
MEITPYDTAAYLQSEEEIAYFLELAFESCDAEEIATALGTVARARNSMRSVGPNGK